MGLVVGTIGWPSCKRDIEIITKMKDFATKQGVYIETDTHVICNWEGYTSFAVSNNIITGRGGTKYRIEIIENFLKACEKQLEEIGVKNIKIYVEHLPH